MHLKSSFSGVFLKMLLLVLASLFTVGSAFCASWGEAEKFSEIESDYIAGKKRITIGIVADDEPYSYMSHGKYEGFSYDVLRAVSGMSGLEFSYRMGNWSEIYKSFINGEIDAIDAISYTEERSKKILFTEPYTTRKTVIFSRADKPVSSLVSPDGEKLRIGVIRSIYYQQQLEKLDNVEVVEYLTYSELMKSLAFGWIDIVVASEFTGLYTSRKYSLSNIMVAGDVDLPGVGEEDFRIGVLAENPVLSSILYKTVKNLSKETMTEIARKWLNFQGADQGDGAKDFTPEEKAFMRTRPVVSIGLMPEFEPFSFYAKDDVYGYTRSLLDLLSSYSGVRFEMVVKQWYELMDDFRNGRLDAVADMSYAPERAKYTLYTEPYYRIPVVVFVRDDFGSYKGMDDLKGKTIGLS